MNATQPVAQSDQDIWVIIPAYNEENIIGDVINELLSMGMKMVIIDDGSTDHDLRDSPGIS